MKLILLLVIPLISSATEFDLQKLLAERSQLEIVNSQLQSEVRAGSGERDRLNERILNIQDELNEMRRKISEAKEKRTHFLNQTSLKKDDTHMKINKNDLETSIDHYENFVRNGIPWDLEARLDKIHELKQVLKTSREPLSESVLQWSQFLEAERKLASETQRRLRRIKIENEEHDATTFRMGLTMFYYKTASGETGVFYRKNQKTYHQRFTDEGLGAKITRLVEAQNEKNSDKLLSELILTPSMTRSEVL